MVLNAATLLDAWERGAAQAPLRRALTLLSAGWPEASPEELAGLTMGQRDGRLLTLREALFGPRFEAVAACPQCGEKLELAFSAQEIRVPAAELAESHCVEIDGHQVRFVPPASADLLDVAETAAGSGQRERLLGRCVQSVSRQGGSVEIAALPETVRQGVMEAMAQADPQADVQVALDCPACLHRWSMAFDILAYLWGEIEDWAARLLLDVHTLASAYGWSERDILAMSSRRRRFYLDRVGG